MEFRERERWAPRRRRLPTKVFATFAIFSISRDFSTTRRSARRAEKWKGVCVSVFVGLHSTLWFRPNDVTAYIGKVKRRYESLSSPRAKFFIQRVCVSTRRPFFPSTITFPSLMGRIVRAVSWRATKRGKCVSVSRWRLLPSDFRFNRWFTSLGKKPKGLKIVRVLLKLHLLKSTATRSLDTSVLFPYLISLFLHFLLSGFWQRYICRRICFASHKKYHRMFVDWDFKIFEWIANGNFESETKWIARTRQFICRSQ